MTWQSPADFAGSYHQEYDLEWIWILSVLWGRNIPKIIHDKETVLKNFLIQGDERKDEEILNLAYMEDYRNFAEF